ncbi:MAG: lytic transglycosylase domain-containing protein [Nitrospirota bacterium]|nr:lytic transglycosylase domain-containing protein [Nitrospirota bacterium]
MERPRPYSLSGIYDYGQEEDTAAVISDSDEPEVQYASYRPSHVDSRISERELDQAIAWYARQHRLSQALLRAVIKTESDFRPSAVSRTGALGLMQLMPRTAASLKVRDPFNPVENIRGGAKHLRYLLDRFHGNLSLALAAYNAGEYRVKRYQQIPPIQETRFYVKKVLSYYHDFRLAKHRNTVMRSSL